jgi:hypothetical protein
VRSFKPYDIILTIKDLQEILRIHKGISTECFNLGVVIMQFVNTEGRNIIIGRCQSISWIYDYV